MKKTISFFLVILSICTYICGAYATEDVIFDQLTEQKRKDYQNYIDFCKKNALCGNKEASKQGPLQNIYIIVPKNKTSYRTSSGKSWNVSPDRPFVLLSYRNKNLSDGVAISICYLIQGSYENPMAFFFVSGAAEPSLWVYELCNLALDDSYVYLYQ